MFNVAGLIYHVGDIVERYYPINWRERGWRYWTTIQTQADAEAAAELDITWYRVIRYPNEESVCRS